MLVRNAYLALRTLIAKTRFRYDLFQLRKLRLYIKKKRRSVSRVNKLNPRYSLRRKDFVRRGARETGTERRVCSLCCVISHSTSMDITCVTEMAF